MTSYQMDGEPQLLMWIENLGEQHSPLPGEQHVKEGASSIEVGEPNLGVEEEQSMFAGGGGEERKYPPSPTMELPGGQPL